MAIKEKDKIIEVNTLEIPEELKELPQWVLWRAEWNNKRQQYEKVPYSLVGIVQAQQIKILGQYSMQFITCMKKIIYMTV